MGKSFIPIEKSADWADIRQSTPVDDILESVKKIRGRVENITLTLSRKDYLDLIKHQDFVDYSGRTRLQFLINGKESMKELRNLQLRVKCAMLGIDDIEMLFDEDCTSLLIFESFGDYEQIYPPADLSLNMRRDEVAYWATHSWEPPTFELSALLKKRREKGFSLTGQEWRSLRELYDKSKEWNARKTLIYARALGLCEKCKNAPIVSIHHLQYEHYGEEYLDDLLGLCEPCHKLTTEQRRTVNVSQLRDKQIII